MARAVGKRAEALLSDGGKNRRENRPPSTLVAEESKEAGKSRVRAGGDRSGGARGGEEVMGRGRVARQLQTTSIMRHVGGLDSYRQNHRTGVIVARHGDGGGRGRRL